MGDREDSELSMVAMYRRANAVYGSCLLVAYAALHSDDRDKRLAAAVAISKYVEETANSIALAMAPDTVIQ